ncbi:MAG: SIS domain-containing protein [Candidatus Omnitrophica bacterium]|nr:SIS domain-containing protein [Candidatus Omnitrophota bacterium]MDD5591877.1 SIS domain-containing protein [Candidatus Omnitrophota bacterium]
MDFFKDYFNQINQGLNSVDTGLLNKTVDLILSVNKRGKKVIISGNGASAAIASHISVDLTKNAKVRSVNFNEADLITCFANDYGYEKWLERAIECYADKDDAVILISSSGESQNIINAAQKAKKLGANLITLSGFNADNPLRKMGDINFWVDSKVYNIVESVHNIWLTAVVEKIAIAKDYK